VAVFFTLAFPALLLIMLSGGGAEAGSVGPSQIRMVPGLIAMILASVGLSSLGTDLASYRERGILRRLGVTPLRPAVFLAAAVLSNALMALIGVLILTLVGRLVLGMPFPGSPVGALVGLAVGATAVLSWGFLLASTVRSTRTAEALASMVFFPMIFLSGAVMPVGALPPALQPVTHVVPLSYVVRAIEDPWVQGAWNVPALIVVAATCAVAVAISARTFRWE
jgi:ABC-2 type transport system permease protein